MISLKTSPMSYKHPLKKNPEVSQVLKQILRNNPKINKRYAKSLSTIIVSKSTKHKVPSKILTAMLMQESAYDVNAKNVRCGVSLYTGKKDCIVVDYGIGQINHKTIKSYNFDKSKLLSNVEYSVEAAAKVLSDLKHKYGHSDKYYWTRYNAGVKKTPIVNRNREIYKSLVARYM